MLEQSCSIADNLSRSNFRTPQYRMDRGDGDMTDMLGELRVLRPAAQLLTAFFVTVPFGLLCAPQP